MIYANIFVYFLHFNHRVGRFLNTELADFRTPSWQISPLGNPAGSQSRKACLNYQVHNLFATQRYKNF